MQDSMSNSCINVSASRIGQGIAVRALRKGDGIKFATSRLGKGISIHAERVGSDMSVNARRIGSGINFRCGLICTVGEAAYLNVEPENIWLLPDNGFEAEVVVYSNVTWVIE